MGVTAGGSRRSAASLLSESCPAERSGSLRKLSVLEALKTADVDDSIRAAPETRCTRR